MEKQLHTIKLHIGAGDQHLDDSYINCDILPRKYVQMVFDAGARWPFVNNSVTKIVSYHMIEHLPRKQALAFLSESFRCLDIGGELVIECPDFEELIAQWDKSESLEQANQIMGNIFGLQRYVGDFHLWGYTVDSLKADLHTVGFRNIGFEPAVDYHAQDGEPCLRVLAVKK